MLTTFRAGFWCNSATTVINKASDVHHSCIFHCHLLHKTCTNTSSNMYMYSASMQPMFYRMFSPLCSHLMNSLRSLPFNLFSSLYSFVFYSTFFITLNSYIYRLLFFLTIAICNKILSNCFQDQRFVFFQSYEYRFNQIKLFFLFESFAYSRNKTIYSNCLDVLMKHFEFH